jgi:mannose-1-phosphate guanylyltransferase
MRHLVIMAGGSGTRFWPLSRQKRPKQLLPLGRSEDQSLIQETVARLKTFFPVENLWIITQKAQKEAISEQIPELSSENFLIEPEGRDTAAAIGLATLHCSHKDPEALIGVLPSDHRIHPPALFQKDIEVAFSSVDESIVTLGIPPTSPHTGYGYIHRGKPRGRGIYEVQQFVEKPNLLKAQEYLQTGEYYWNAGFFFFHHQTILQAFARYQPELYGVLQKLQAALGTPSFEEKLLELYPQIPKISIDFGVIEHFKPLRVVETHFEWDDVGSFTALERYGIPDAQGNIVYGDFLGVESQGLLIHSKNHLIATLGLHDIAIIHTEDATLIVPKNRIEELKKLIDPLKKHRKDLL